MSSSRGPKLSIIVPHRQSNYSGRDLAGASPSPSKSAQDPSPGVYVPLHKRSGWVSPYSPTLSPRAYSRLELLSLASASCYRDIRIEVKRTCPEILLITDSSSAATPDNFTTTTTVAGNLGLEFAGRPENGGFNCLSSSNPHDDDNVTAGAILPPPPPPPPQSQHSPRRGAGRGRRKFSRLVVLQRHNLLEGPTPLSGVDAYGDSEGNWRAKGTRVGRPGPGPIPTPCPLAGAY